MRIKIRMFTQLLCTLLIRFRELNETLNVLFCLCCLLEHVSWNCIIKKHACPPGHYGGLYTSSKKKKKKISSTSRHNKSYLVLGKKTGPGHIAVTELNAHKWTEAMSIMMLGWLNVEKLIFCWNFTCFTQICFFLKEEKHFSLFLFYHLFIYLCVSYSMTVLNNVAHGPKTKRSLMMSRVYWTSLSHNTIQSLDMLMSCWLHFMLKQNVLVYRKIKTGW